MNIFPKQHANLRIPRFMGNYYVRKYTVFLFLIISSLLHGCASEDDTSPPWNTEDLPELFTIQDRDYSDPSTRTVDGLITLSGQVFEESGPPDGGVSVSWLNSTTGSKGAAFTFRGSGIGSLWWEAEIPLTWGDNKLFFSAMGVSGRSAELSIIITRVPYRPEDYTVRVCDDQATIYWLYYLGGATSFDLFYSSGDVAVHYGSGTLDDKEGVFRIKNVQPPYRLSGLDPNLSYNFKIAGITKGGLIGFSSIDFHYRVILCNEPDPVTTSEDLIWALPGNSYIDLDTGAKSSELNLMSDIYWDADAGRIEPVNGALLKNNWGARIEDFMNDFPYKSITSESDINSYFIEPLVGYYDVGSTFYDVVERFDYCYGICLHHVFTVYTSSGNFSKLQILEYKPEELRDGTSKYLVFRFYTFK